MTLLDDLLPHVNWQPKPLITGSLSAVRSNLAFARIPLAAVGDLCFIDRRSSPPLPAQVISFSEDLCCLAPFDSLVGVSPGAQVTATSQLPTANLVGDPRGLVLDALGLPLGGHTSEGQDSIVELALDAPPPKALAKRPIERQLITGVRSIDSLNAIGYGQRLGLFASAGVGKSTLLGTIARTAAVDVSVIALVGERGREVREFIDNCLERPGMRRSVVVVATSDESPLRRLLAPKTATAIAEWYRSRGLNVLLLVDSLTRTARAIREVELASGAIPVRQGYTTGVYSELPRLLERAGNDDRGSITAIYSVLTSGNEEFDPLADEIKSILDGHLILDPRIAQSGIQPSIDPLASVSRLAHKLYDPAYQRIRQTIISILARLRRDRDIVLMGGTPDPELAAALRVEPELMRFLNQAPNDTALLPQSLKHAAELVENFERFKSELLQKA